MSAEVPISVSLAMLGYSPLWLEWGFLSVATLKEQVASFHTGQDTKAEHYRFATFRQILSSHSVLADQEIEQYIALADMDPDKTMAQSALIDLLEWPGLTAEQFDRLSLHPRFASHLFQKHAMRRRLLSELESSSTVSMETFALCLDSRDAKVQWDLLSHRQLTPEQFDMLAEKGSQIGQSATLQQIESRDIRLNQTCDCSQYVG